MTIRANGIKERSGTVDVAFKGGKHMRVTTKMVNDSAQKAGLPGISNSLLNVMDQGGDENSPLSSLEKSGY